MPNPRPLKTVRKSTLSTSRYQLICHILNTFGHRVFSVDGWSDSLEQPIILDQDSKLQQLQTALKSVTYLFN